MPWTHPLALFAEMVAQRIYGLALKYEDLNDHEQLRRDPLLHVLTGKAKMDEPLAGKSTLNRLELGDGRPRRYKKITYWKDGINALLVDVFLEAFPEPPAEIVLDLDKLGLVARDRLAAPNVVNLLPEPTLPLRRDFTTQNYSSSFYYPN